MRIAIVFSLVLVTATLAHAQEQEGKLIDRLLKPNMKLQNDAQGKQFAIGGSRIAKQAPVKMFYIKERKAEPGFWNTRKVSTKEFATESSRDAQTRANLSTRSDSSKLNTAYATGGYREVREAVDAHKSQPVSDYAGNRQFLVKGKSQKFLNSHNKPMTIDQVRELLNKNK